MSWIGDSAAGAIGGTIAGVASALIVTGIDRGRRAQETRRAIAAAAAERASIDYVMDRQSHNSWEIQRRQRTVTESIIVRVTKVVSGEPEPDLAWLTGSWNIYLLDIDPEDRVEIFWRDDNGNARTAHTIIRAGVDHIELRADPLGPRQQPHTL